MSATPPAPPAPPKLPTGRELYDALMAHIEPELTTVGSKLIEAQYKSESAANHKARMQKYALAFERCEKAYQEYMLTLDAQVNRYRREAFGHAELEDRGEENAFLDQLGTLFHQAI